MTELLERAGAAFIRAFGVTLLFFATGILNAPNLETARALSIAALLGSIAAGLRAVQVFVPQISFEAILPIPWFAWADSFTRAFLAALLISITGWLATPDFSTWKSVLIAAVVGAGAAGFRAVQGLFTQGETPAPDKGLKTRQ